MTERQPEYEPVSAPELEWARGGGHGRRKSPVENNEDQKPARDRAAT